MKNLTTAILVALFALTAVACGPVESSPDFEGVYQGTESAAYEFTYADGYVWEDSEISETSLTITTSQSGDLLITNLVEDCPLPAVDEGDYFTISGICVTNDGWEGERLGLRVTGEGELTPSGRLKLTIEGDVSIEEEFAYDHGFEWEVVGSGKIVGSFTGTPM